jgi:hypothetical protein
MERLSMAPDEEYYQGDEKGSPVNFFASVRSNEKLNRGFLALRDEERFSAARGIIEPMMRWYRDIDGNFIEQFQTTGFDARIWELYLFAAFTEMSYDIDREFPAPDLSCRNPLTEFFVEAVTLNPSKDENGNDINVIPDDFGADMRSYLEEYMPIRFAGALISKLAKRYWDLPHVAGKPLLFAIQDFSAPRSMTYTRSAFEAYVTGYRHFAERDDTNKLVIRPEKIGEHRWKTKSVPSGFFEQPEADNVSAILFSNSGTLNKFNRMGRLVGFGSSRVHMHRVGLAVNHDPNSSEPNAFRQNVSDSAYQETWEEGIDIWHNPKAKYPLNPRLFPGCAHHRLLKGGQVQSLTPEWHPLSSTTVYAIPRT